MGCGFGGPAFSRSAAFRWVAAVIVAGFSLSMLGGPGCQKSWFDGSFRPIPPQTEPLPPAPPDAEADVLLVDVSSDPYDTNANGYPDLIEASAHLFDSRYEPSIHEEGAFLFALYEPGGAGDSESEPIRQWRFEGGELEETHSRSGFGECYRFKLSLLGEGGDRLPMATGEVVGRFEPADGGDFLYAQEIGSIRLGRRFPIRDLEWQKEP